MLEEPFLEGELPEDVKALLKMDKLKGMLASDMDGAFDEGQSSESSANLVDLDREDLLARSYIISVLDGPSSTHPVEKSPIPCLSQERELLQHATQEAILEDKSIRRRQDLLVSQDLELAPAECRLLMGSQGWCRARAPAVGRRAPLLVPVDIIALLVALVAGPAGFALPEAVVLVAVEVGATKEQRHHDEGLEKCADTHC